MTLSRPAGVRLSTQSRAIVFDFNETALVIDFDHEPFGFSLTPPKLKLASFCISFGSPEEVHRRISL
jgi:hypothetical protein